MKNIYYSLIFYLIIIVKTVLIGFLWESEQSPKAFSTDGKSPFEVILFFFFVVIIETLLCNLLLYHLLSKIKYLNQNTPFLIFISSLIFGALHFTGFEYMKFPVSSFISGVFYNINFILYYKKDKKMFRAVLATFLLHFAHNLTIYIINTYT